MPHRTVVALAALATAAAGCVCGATTGLVMDAGTDGTDAAPDAPCDRITVSSNLPGVRFDLSGNRCRYTLAEVAAGVSFSYRTVVDAPSAGVVQTLSATRCDPSDPSGLQVDLQVGGTGQSYCWCDCGLGPGGTWTVDLAAGTYSNALDWTGVNWYGPSDTGMPYGSPFPPGTYQFTARASGSAPAPGGSAPFVVEGTLTFDLVP